MTTIINNNNIHLQSFTYIYIYVYRHSMLPFMNHFFGLGVPTTRQEEDLTMRCDALRAELDSFSQAREALGPLSSTCD